MGQELVQNSRNVRENKATFFKLNSKICSSINLSRQSRRQSVSTIDSDASIPVIRKTDLSSKELETIEVSRLLLTVITTDGSIDTTEETIVDLKELDIFVTIQLLEDTPAVQHLGNYEENGYSYEWKEDRTPSLIKNDKIVPLRLR